MRTLVVGDIHGCHAELLQLIDLADLGSGDRLISIGDAIDRGPASVRVIDLLRTRPNTTWVMGNHERKHVRSFRGETAAALSQSITRRQVGEAAYPALVDYLDTLPRYLSLLGRLEPQQDAEVTEAQAHVLNLILVAWHALRNGRTLAEWAEYAGLPEDETRAAVAALETIGVRRPQRTAHRP